MSVKEGTSTETETETAPIAIAVNFSEALMEALTTDVSVDYIKVPLSRYPENRQAILRASAVKPLLLHPTQPKVIDIAQPLDDMSLGEAELLDLLNLTQSPSLSTHMAVTHSHIDEDKGVSSGVDLRLSVSDRIIRNCSRVHQLLNRYRPCTPLLLENHSFWPGVLPFSCEPEFFSDVAMRSGCELLIDLAHARVSAYNLGIDVLDYLRRYDLSRVGEIHVSGPRYFKGLGLTDAHGAMTEEDYGVLKWILGSTRPRIVSLEYGGMPDIKKEVEGRIIELSRNRVDELIDQLEKLKTILK